MYANLEVLLTALAPDAEPKRETVYAWHIEVLPDRAVETSMAAHTGAVRS